MIFVMSDIHGCYDKYKKMLDKIALTENDILFILGDVLDRGPYGIKVLLDIEKRNNVVLLKGNHDLQAGILLSNLHLLDMGECPQKLVELYGIWLSDGGDTSLEEYLELSDDERVTAITVVDKAKLYHKVKVNGNIYHLSHTVPEYNRIDEYPQWREEDYVLGEPNYEKVYFKDMILVTGHTPTGIIDAKSAGCIWKKNNHIAIDCGAVYGKCLGCLCLDTMEEYYV